jgi:cytoskeletal protein RodZ
MKTIGTVMKEARVKEKYSRKDLERQTKIKREYIKALEEENWDLLPELPVLRGFVKNLASVLSIKQGQIMALLRRDYPPRAMKINPKPDIEPRFTWSPKLTFIFGVVFISLLVLGYLGFQYINFITPPSLSVDVPDEGLVVTQELLAVSGETDPEAVVTVNNQPVIVDGDGKFATTIEVFEGTGEIIVISTSRSGKETEVRRKIYPDLDN